MDYTIIKYHLFLIKKPKVWLIVAEILILRFLDILNIRLSNDKAKIPEGMYCYSHDDNGKYCECKYYKSYSNRQFSYGFGCTYSRFFGYDPCFSDQCKICGEKDNF